MVQSIVITPELEQGCSLRNLECIRDSDIFQAVGIGDELW